MRADFVPYMKSVRFAGMGNVECAGYSNNWLKMHGIQKRAWKQLDNVTWRIMSARYYRSGKQCEECNHKLLNEDKRLKKCKKCRHRPDRLLIYY